MAKSKKGSRPSPKARPKPRRSPLRWLVWTGVVVCLLPFLLLGMLHLPWVQQALLDLAVGQLRENTAIDIRLGAFRWHPFSNLRLLDLKILSSGKELLQCERAELSYYWSAHPPYFHPVDLDLEKPFLKLEKDSEGRWKLPKVGERPAQKEPSDVPLWVKYPLQRIRLHSARVVAHQEGETILSVRDIDGTLSLFVDSDSPTPALNLNLDLWEGHVEAPNWGEWRLFGKARLKEGSIEVSQLVARVGDKTRLKGRGHWSMASSRGGKLHLKLDPLMWSTFPELRGLLPQLERVTGTLDLSTDGNRWHLDHAFETNRGTLNGHLEALHPTRDGAVFQWSANFKQLRIPLSGVARSPLVNGTLDLELEGTDPKDLEARWQARLTSMEWGPERIHEAELRGSYRQGELALTARRVQSSLGAFSFSANADLRGLWDEAHSGEARVMLEVDEANLKKVFENGDQTVNGRAFVQARYQPGTARDWQKWTGEVDVDFQAPSLLSLEASGSFDEKLLNLQYHLSAQDLGKFSRFFPFWEGSGRIESKGAIEGEWPRWLWQGEATATGMSYGPIQAERARLQGSAPLTGRDGPRRLSLKGSGLDVSGTRIGSVHLQLDQKGAECGFELQGSDLGPIASANMKGTVGRIWSPNRVVAIDQGSLMWSRETLSFSGSGELMKGLETVTVRSFQGSYGGQEVSLKGRLSQTGSSDLLVNLENVRVERWLALLDRPALLQGRLGGRLQLTGSLEAPRWELTGSVEDGTLLNQEDFDRLELQGTYDGNRMDFQGRLHASAFQAPAAVEARIPLRLGFKPFRWELPPAPASSLSVKMQGLDAAHLQPHLAFAGKLKGSLELDGKALNFFKEPKLDARARWRGGGMELKGWPHPISQVELAVEADSRRLRIPGGSLRVLGGQVELRGAAEYGPFSNLNLQARVQEVHVPEFFGVTGKGSGQLRLTALPSRPHVKGRIELSNAEMDLKDLESDLAKNIQVIEFEGQGDEIRVAGSQKKHWFDKMNLDLELQLPPSGTWVRGKGLEAEITGALRLTKEVKGPLRMSGTLETLRGTYRFQNTEMKIVEGEMTFLGLPRPDPELAFLTEKDVRDVVIQARVTGSLTEPRLTLSSIPAMEQVDILSYLVFQRPAGELDSSESSALQDRAAFWLGSKASRLLKQALADAPFAPDILELRTTEEGGVVEIGKELTSDLSVSYEKGIEGDDHNQVRLEYRLNRHLSVQSEIGDEQQSGVDILFRYDFGE